MIQVISNMPVGTIGLQASGKVSEQDYRDVRVPTINAALEQGNVRLLVRARGRGRPQARPRAGRHQDVFKNHKGWECLANVSDVDWLENPLKAFGWLLPGEVKVFESDVRDAKQWFVGLDDD